MRVHQDCVAHQCWKSCVVDCILMINNGNKSNLQFIYTALNPPTRVLLAVQTRLQTLLLLLYITARKAGASLHASEIENNYCCLFLYKEQKIILKTLIKP